jgi:hypothetical protein
MRDGLAQRLFLRLLQRRRLITVEAGRVFAVRAEHLREEALRHFVMLAVGGVRVLGDRPQHHLSCEGGIVGCAVCGEAHCGARAQALDGGADHEVRQRHAFGSPDDRGHDAHAAIPSRGGNGKNMLVRDW